MSHQNITVMQERYKSNAYVWQSVRLGFTFLTAKNIFLNARLSSDGRQNPNKQPNISLVFVSLSSCEPNKKILGSILVLLRPLKP